MVSIRLSALAAGLLVAAPSLRADVPGYKVQSIVHLGDAVGNLKIRSSGDFEVGALNDSGQIALVTENQAGGEMLLAYSGGMFLPIAVGNQTVSGVKWARGIGIWSSVQMNQQGDIAFATTDSRKTYRWDHQSGQASVIAAAGAPAVNDLTFSAGGDITTAAINDYGEIAFQATVKDSSGKAQKAIFFFGRDGKLMPVLLPGQMVTGVGTIQPHAGGGALSLNNAGVVGFQARHPGDKSDGVFLWENGTITPVALPGADAPGGGKFVLLGGGIVNNVNSDVVLFGNLDGTSAHWGEYRLTGGQLVPVAVPGQEMPGGGQFMGGASGSVSASSAGETVLIARLVGGDTAIYRVDAAGKPSLILRGSDLGAKIVSLSSFGIAINGKGQVALPVRFTGDKVDTLVVLTPASP